MATFYWAGSTGYTGGWGNPGFTQGYLDGITSGMSWNVSSNWLVETFGPSGGCGQSGNSYQQYENAETALGRCPGAGDTVKLRRIYAGKHVCAQDDHGLGQGVTGDIPYAPLLFGGYYNTALNEGTDNLWSGGGGWIGAGAGNTAGRLASMKVFRSYFHSEAKSGDSFHEVRQPHGDYPERVFPLGLLANKVTKIEALTGKGGTFSGLQIYAQSFDLLPPIGNANYVPVSTATFNMGENHCALILSDIENTTIKNWPIFEAYGCTFDQIEVSRTNLPGHLGSQSISRHAEPTMAGMVNIGKIQQTTRGNAGNASWANFPSTISTVINFTGRTGGHAHIKTTATIPTLNVAENWRKFPTQIDANVTTMNLYPERAKPCFSTDAECEGGNRGTYSPVMYVHPEFGRTGVHTVTTLNMKDNNPVWGNSIDDNHYDGIKGKGWQNQLALRCGVTFDTVNIDAGLLYVGGQKYGDWGGSKVPYGCDNPGHSGPAHPDMHAVLIKDGTLGAYAVVDHRHSDWPAWKRFKVGNATTHPSLYEGYTLLDGAATMIWACDHYVVGDFAYAGATSAAQIAVSRKG